MPSLLVPFLIFALGAAPVPEVRTVVFLGDSLTAGYGLSKAEAYPGLIEARIRAAGLPWKVVNAGVTGDTSAGARARLDWVLRQKPQLVFLCIGANDGLRGIPVAETERNLRAILDRAKKEHIRVVLAGVMLPENYGAGYREAFRSQGIPIAIPPVLAGRRGAPPGTEPGGRHPSQRAGRGACGGARLERRRTGTQETLVGPALRSTMPRSTSSRAPMWRGWMLRVGSASRTGMMPTQRSRPASLAW